MLPLRVHRGPQAKTYYIDIKAPAKLHIMGISGTAMSALAGLLKGKGYQVSGSDQNFYPPAGEELKKMGIPTMEGYKRENIHKDLDLVIVGNVISKCMPETQALLESNLPYISLPEALNFFIINDKQIIMVCGTHGKTTVSSLSAWLLQEAGLNPGFLMGGVSENFKTGFRNNNSSYFILEGDEYDTAFFEKTPKFIHYPARYTLLNNIEFDHADIYKDIKEVKEAFRPLVERSSYLIAGVDSPVVEKLLPLAPGKVVTYGVRGGGEWCLRKREPLKEGGQILQVDHNGLLVAEFQIPLSGEYNALNALAVWLLSKALNLDSKKTLSAFKSFRGVRRRFQILGTFAGCTLVEDFAHHPTAVQAVLSSVRERYPGRRVVALFEPRSNTSRRNIFQKEYAQAFSLADLVFCLSVAQEEVSGFEPFSARKLVVDLSRKKTRAFEVNEISDMLNLVLGELVKGDVVLMMSNGDFGGIYGRLKKELESR